MQKKKTAPLTPYQSRYQAGRRFTLAERFRSFLPVVIDLETGGFDAPTDALLEIAAVLLRVDDSGLLQPLGEPIASNVIPFEGARIMQESLDVNGIKPFHPLRAARSEKKALEYVFDPIHQAVQREGCSRAILVGHNAFFDLSFLNAAVGRTLCNNPFHLFSTLDTVSLSALVLGETVLARSLQSAGLEWDPEQAHSAIYDARQTATLFCHLVNRWEVCQR